MAGFDVSRWMTPGFNPQGPAQPTVMYTERIPKINTHFVLEQVMRGLVSDVLEEKLNHKFEPIDERLKSIEESIQEISPIRKIVVLETVTREEAKERIEELIRQTEGEFYPDEIAEKLCIDFQLVMEIVNELIDEKEIEVAE